MQTLTVTASLRITNAIRQNGYRYRGRIKIPTNKSLAATPAAAYRANKENKERKRNHANWLEAALSLIALMALPGVIVGGAVAFFTRKVQRAARAFLLAELVWLLALALVAVVPAHGTQTAIWLHPTINTRLIYEKVRAGASYEQALRDTQPAMRRKLEADTFGCAKTMPRPRRW